MIVLWYQDRLANRIGEYCFARLLADRAQCSLIAWPIRGFPSTGSTVRMGLPPLPSRIIRVGGHNPDLDRLVEQARSHHVLLHGWFMRYEFFRDHRAVIQHWLRTDVTAPALRSNDLTIHVRSGDIWQSEKLKVVHSDYHALPWSFYRGILERRTWGRVYVVTEAPHDPMVQKLAKVYSGEVVSRSPLEDFSFIRASANVVLSASSFAWWAAWLSEAESIFYPVVGIFDPERMNRRPEPMRPDFVIPDDRRYISVRPEHAEEHWTGTPELRERLLHC